MRYINQIDISKISFMPCPIFQELKPLCFLRKLKDCLPYSEAGWFFRSSLLGLGMGGWFSCLTAADKAKRSLCPSLQAVCKLQWNFEQVKQHIVCVADVSITSSSVIMDFPSSNYETEMTSICFYWWWHLNSVWCSQNKKCSIFIFSLRTEVQIKASSVFMACT